MYRIMRYFYITSTSTARRLTYRASCAGAYVCARVFCGGIKKGVYYDTPPSGRWSLVKKQEKASKGLTKSTHGYNMVTVNK